MNDGEFHITYSYVDTSVWLPGSFGTPLTGAAAEAAFFTPV